MKKIIFITFFFISTFSFAQDWQQQLNQLTNDMVKIANDARIAKEKRQQEEKQRLEAERQRKEQERLKQEQEKQEAIQIFNGKMPEYTDIVSNPNNPEMKYYMDYIVYQAQKAGFEFVDMSTCFSDEENAIVRKSLAYFKKNNTNVSIGVGFWLNESSQSFRRILWCYCSDNCGIIGDIKLSTFLDKSLSTTNGLVINENSIPKSIPSSFLVGSKYRGFEIESNIDQKESILAYRHNAQLTKICHSNENIANQITWYKKAADLGDTQSMLDVAETYEKKLTDFISAIKYYERYFNKTNDTVTADYIARLYASKNLNDLEKANEWFVKAGWKDETIGRIYQYDLKNNVAALSFYKKVADEDNNYLYSRIADIYFLGENGITKDFNEAKKWYIKHLENNNDSFTKANVFSNIGYLYVQGCDNFPRNYQIAINYFIKSINLFDNEVYMFQDMKKIAELYSSTIYELKGTNLNQDYNEAKNWYLKVLELTLNAKEKYDIMMSISKLYETGGENLKKSKSEAKYWKNKADGK
jgi:TPR repeat protein